MEDKRSEDYIDERKDEFPDNDTAHRMIDGIVEMRQLGILADGNRRDGEPIISEDIIGLFLNNLDWDCKYELEWSWLQGRPVQENFVDRMIDAMIRAVRKQGGTNKKELEDERVQLYVGLLGCIKPFYYIIRNHDDVEKKFGNLSKYSKLVGGVPPHKARARMDEDSNTENEGYR